MLLIYLFIWHISHQTFWPLIFSSARQLHVIPVKSRHLAKVNPGDNTKTERNIEFTIGISLFL